MFRGGALGAGLHLVLRNGFIKTPGEELVPYMNDQDVWPVLPGKWPENASDFFAHPIRLLQQTFGSFTSHFR